MVENRKADNGTTDNGPPTTGYEHGAKRQAQSSDNKARSVDNRQRTTDNDDEQRAEVVLKAETLNGASGTSDIEGKVTRVGASECGQRMSFKR